MRKPSDVALPDIVILEAPEYGSRLELTSVPDVVYCIILIAFDALLPALFTACTTRFPWANGADTVTLVVTDVLPQALFIVYDIIALPAAIPLTVPVLDIVATAVLALVHVPPVIASLRVVVDPIYVVAKPVIGPGAGSGFTVTAYVAVQPVGKV